MTKQKTNNIQM